FEDLDYPDKFYKVVKALYGLHQALRPCEKPLLKDPDGEDVDVHTYRLMIGSLMYLTSSRPDIMFAKQTVVATSSTKAEYVAAAGAASATDNEVPPAVDEPSILSPTPPTPPPQPSQGQPSTSEAQLTPPQAHPQSPQHQPQPSQDAIISMDLLQNLLDTCTTLKRRVENLEHDKIAQSLEITKLKQRVKKLERMNKASKLQRLKKDVVLDAKIDGSVNVQGRKAESQAQIYQIDLEHADKVLSMQDDKGEPAELQEVVEVVTTDKLITKVVTAASAAEVNVEDVSTADVAAEGAASATDNEVPPAVDEPSILSPTPPTPPPQPSHRDRRGSRRCKIFNTPSLTKMVFANMKRVGTGFSREVTSLFDNMLVEAPEEVCIVQADTQSIPITTEPSTSKPQKKHKPKRKHAQESEVPPTESPAKQNLPSPSNDSLPSGEDSLKLKELMDLKQKEDNAVKRYQALKRKPQIKAQARKNMMIYLRNVAGFKMDYFKGMIYDDIRPIFEKYFNSNVAFLQKTKEQMEEEDSRALKRLSESQEDKASKNQKLDEKVEELKKHLMIVPNDDDDDVYTEATPLALKVPIVDYEIHTENNKPYYKIKRADSSHQLYLSFLSMLRNFDREDLEVLWRLVKERFPSIKPKNFSDDFLLTTLGAMFEKLDIQAQIWKNQRSVHSQAKVKSWKLLESCGVQIITFTTTQLILLVERRYLLIMFTLDQMLNNVRLEVEEESEVSLELLRFIRQQHQEGFRLE
nr:hypothetical protein [Tanacetum cinerariifolium]